jgi:hypothetical protein
MSKHRAGRARIRLQELHQKRAVATSNIHDRIELAEVVGLDSRTKPVSNPACARHGSIEERARRRIACEVLVERHSENTLTGGFTSPHGLKHVGPQCAVDFTVQEHAGLDRIRVVGPKIFAKGCQAEQVAVDLGADAEANQAAEHTPKADHIGREGSAKFRWGSVTIPKLVGEPELRGDVQDLGVQSTEGHVEQGRNLLLRMFGLRRHTSPRIVLTAC